MIKKLSILFILLFIGAFFTNISPEKSVQKEGEIMDREVTIIEFPLRGEWVTEVSPADRIPSHGTNRFGLRYAFDFIQVNWDNAKHPTHDKKTQTIFSKVFL